MIKDMHDAWSYDWWLRRLNPYFAAFGCVLWRGCVLSVPMALLAVLLYQLA